MNSPFLTDNSCASVEIAGRQLDPFAQSVKLNTRPPRMKLMKEKVNASRRRRDMSRGAGIRSADRTLSAFTIWNTLAFSFQLPRSKRSFLFRHAECFSHLSYHIKEIYQEDRQCSLTQLIYNKPCSVNNGALSTDSLQHTY